MRLTFVYPFYHTRLTKLVETHTQDSKKTRERFVFILFFATSDGFLLKEGIRKDGLLNAMIDGVRSMESGDNVEWSVDQLYEKVCDLQSSDHSSPRHSLGTEEDESQIDLELHHIVNGKMREVDIMEEDEDIRKSDCGDDSSDSDFKRDSSSTEMPVNLQSAGASTSSPSKVTSYLQMKSEASRKHPAKPPADRYNDEYVKTRMSVDVALKKYGIFSANSQKLQNGNIDTSNPHLDYLELGSFLLKQARDVMSSGDDAQEALDLATRAAESFEKCADGKPNLDLVICLHVIATSYCSLGLYNDAVPVLKRLIEIPVAEEDQDNALARFAGYMQLGDAYAMLGLLEKSISCYTNGLEFLKQVLGDNDPRIGETCRYLAAVHMQAMQFDESQKLCQIALGIHKKNGLPDSFEEAVDRRLMGMICELKGNHKAALEHLMLARMAMVANGQEKEVASVDCSIGDAYLSLNKYDEAISAYQKALGLLESSKRENRLLVGTTFVRLADLYNKTGNLEESRSCCENALQIYEKSIPGISPEETASGFASIAVIYESLGEPEHALKLLQKALEIYDHSPGQQTTIAAIEAQVGILYYVLEKYSESYTSLKGVTTMLRASGEKKSAFFGVVLNQMGLACVQIGNINEALQLFEESKSILEHEYGPYHEDTLGVYSNLAGAYDAVGRVDDAIEFLELIVQMREDVDDEKNRLAELLKEVGSIRNRRR